MRTGITDKASRKTPAQTQLRADVRDKQSFTENGKTDKYAQTDRIKLRTE